jgi:hypothetical protein
VHPQAKQDALFLLNEKHSIFSKDLADL